MQLESTLVGLSVPIGLSFAINLLSSDDDKVANKEIKNKSKNNSDKTKAYKSKKVSNDINTARKFRLRSRRVFV
jgi:hypothetical protein